jgi:hypothetical protein
VLAVLALPEVIAKVDRAFVFVTDPQKSLSREADNKLSMQDGRIMNTSLLSALRTAADTWKSSELRKPPIVTMDTSTLDGDVQKTALIVLREIDSDLRREGIEIQLPAALSEEDR